MSIEIIPTYGDFSFMNNDEAPIFTTLFNVIEFYKAHTIFTPEKQSFLFDNSMLLNLIRDDNRMEFHSPTSLSLYLQAIKKLYIDGWESFYYNYINNKKKHVRDLHTEIEKLCYPYTFKKYSYKDVEYDIGEIEFETIKSDTFQILSQFKNQVIVFNDYFSLNEINGDVSVFSTDLCVDFKSLNNFYLSNINMTHSAEFIILPRDYVLSNDTINLVIDYISNNLYKNYDKEHVEDYITQLKNTFTGKLNDSVKFNKPIIFRLDSVVIENLTEESDEEHDDEHTEEPEHTEEHEE